MNNLFIAVQFLEVQPLMELEGFDKNSILINNGELYEEYGDSAYMVRKSWLDKNNVPKYYSFQ